MTPSLLGTTSRRTVGEVIDAQAIEMAFQPVVQLDDGTVWGYEALARFEQKHFPSPTHAFAAAHDAGIGVDLELLAVECALERLDDLPSGVWLSTNLSVEALMSPRVCETLLSHAHRDITVELTEHIQVTDYPALVAATNRLREAGILLAVDDAGAGFASLSHILQLRPDIIKLDITLTRNIDADPVRSALARSLVSFAHDIDALLIAEGIETDAERDKLRSLGVVLGQGYLMAVPGRLPS
jgi:EAL domain-containing protein (putative c-di-GMP-specific phosphodiesterase class I)